MLERWRTFELTPDGFRETVIAIGDTLQKLGVSDKEAESGKLLVEHIYSLQLSKRPVVCDKVKVRKRFGDVSLRLETKGDEYNPLQMLEEWNEEDPDYVRTVFLKSKKEQLSYAHKNGLNIVTIRVREAGNKQICYTLFAMVLGILAGAVLKSIVSPEMIEMLNKNVVNSIRTMFLNSLNMMIAPAVFLLHSPWSYRQHGRRLLLLFYSGDFAGEDVWGGDDAGFCLGTLRHGRRTVHRSAWRAGRIFCLPDFHHCFLRCSRGSGGNRAGHRPADFHVPYHD